MIDQNTIGNQIRKARLYRGYSQRDLSRKAGITQGIISQYENGTVRISAIKLYKIATTLDVPIEFFFSNDDLEARNE